MPTIPTYGGAQVRSTALQPVNQSSFDVSSGARALGGALDNVAQVADRTILRDADTEAWKAQAKIADDFDKWDTAERQKSQGSNAAGFRAKADAWWTEAQQSAASSLSPIAQRAVGKSLATIRNSTLRSASDYEAQQVEAGNVSALSASASKKINLAIKQGPGGAPPIIQSVGDEVQKFFKDRGKDGTVEALRITTGAHETILNQLLQRDPTQAALYFNTYKDGIDPTRWDEMTGRINQITASNEGDAAAGGVWSVMGPKSYTDAVKLDSMESELRKQFANDKPRRDSAIAGLRERAQAHNSTQSEVAAQGTVSAWATYNKTKSMAAMKADPGWKMIPADKQAALESSIINLQTAALNRDEASIRRSEAQQHRTYSATYHAVSDPEVLARMTRAQVQALEPTIGREYTGHLLNRYDSISKSPAALGDAKVDHQDMLAIMQEMGLKPFKKGQSEDGKAMLGVVQSRIERGLTLMQQDAKRMLTREEKNKFIRLEVAKEASVQTTFWGMSTGSDTMPIVEMDAEQLKRVIVPPQVLPDIRSKMAALYGASNGMLQEYQPTEENLRRYYLTHYKKSAIVGAIPSKNAK